MKSKAFSFALGALLGLILAVFAYTQQPVQRAKEINLKKQYCSEMVIGRNTIENF